MIEAMSLQWGNASLVEVLWTLAGLAGAGLTRGNLQSASKQTRAIRKMNGNNIARADMLRIIAFGHYRNEMFRMIIFAAIVASGVFSMIQPAASKRTPITPTGVLITALLFLIVAILIMASALDRRQREILLSDREFRTRSSRAKRS